MKKIAFELIYHSYLPSNTSQCGYGKYEAQYFLCNGGNQQNGRKGLKTPRLITSDTRMYQELKKLNNSKNNPVKADQEHKQRTKVKFRWPEMQEKMFKIARHRGNPTTNHRGLSSPQVERLSHGNQSRLSAIQLWQTTWRALRL